MRLLLLNINYLQYQNIIKTMQKNIMDFEHPILQGVTNERALPQGVALRFLSLITQISTWHI
mgnify:FL=1